jgi:copper chaperone NosL
MQPNRINSWKRITLVICGIALLLVLFFPIWRIELNAPQYPEGLTLLIYAGNLSGDVAIINGLNHYIGMKALNVNDFVEFTVLPYLIVFFALLFILTGWLARRKLLYLLLGLFVAFGLLAMVDFWRWEYNYGHNLNPNAAIIVPGMAYQPPLIGFKQLLNFGAYSIPDIGGWIFVTCGAILLFVTVMEWKLLNKLRRKNFPVTVVLLLILLVGFESCNTGVVPIQIGIDNCTFCKMTISDVRFGAEIITKKGKVYKFDDAHCILSFLQLNRPDQKDIKNIYFTDFDQHSLVKLNEVSLFKSDALRSPMGGNIAAFSNRNSMEKIKSHLKGTEVKWNELNK